MDRRNIDLFDYASDSVSHDNDQPVSLRMKYTA